MMKRVLSVLLAGVMTLGLVGCGSNGNAATGDKEGTVTIKEGQKYPEKTVKIGVEIYDATDAEFLELKKYYSYLAETINVEFVYSEAIKSPEAELSFIENCAVSGVKGIIGYYNVSKAQVVQKATDLGMYYYGSPDMKEIYDGFKDNKLYLGGVTYGDANLEAGSALGQYIVDKGAKNIVFSSGGANFGVPMFVERRNGFLAAIEKAKAAGADINVIDVPGFPDDAFFAAQQAALTKDIDAVVASFNGVDFWAQPIATAGKKDSVPLTTIGSLNENAVKAFQDGSIAFLAAANIQRYGIGVGLIVNAVDGNGDALRNSDGSALNLTDKYWLISDAEQAKTIFNKQENDRIFSAKDILSLCKGVNADASVQKVSDIIEKSTIESITGK